MFNVSVGSNFSLGITLLSQNNTEINLSFRIHFG